MSVVILSGAIWEFTLVFSGRAAYIETGVLIGTIMTGNVWSVIVPSQHSRACPPNFDRAQEIIAAR